MIDLSTPKAVYTAIQTLSMAPVYQQFASGLGFGRGEFNPGWQVGTIGLPCGDVVVLWHSDDQVANVRYHAPSGEFLRVESHDLSQESKLFFVAKRTHGALCGAKRASENDLDDTNPVAVVKKPVATEAELDQFYCSGGFFKVMSSHDLPAELLAHALLVGWHAIATKADAYIEGRDARRA